MVTFERIEARIVWGYVFRYNSILQSSEWGKTKECGF